MLLQQANYSYFVADHFSRYLVPLRYHNKKIHFKRVLILDVEPYEHFTPLSFREQGLASVLQILVTEQHSEQNLPKVYFDSSFQLCRDHYSIKNLEMTIFTGR